MIPIFRCVYPGLMFTSVMLVSLVGCRGRQEPTPGGASTPPSAVIPTNQPLPSFAKYLEGMRVCLDPGHGGDANRPNFKRGPTGLREAEVNLRVALMLRDMLQANGAIVVMTRQTDTALADNDEDDLRLRAEAAEKNGCDLLLSIHHNAGDRPKANFTTVWYHGDVDWSPASLDMAREVAVALLEELRLPEQIGVPVLSDELIYPKSGFRVLRLARVPAVLSEASFHTNPAEEQLLRDPEYNRREARALFVGLARYALGGVPKMRLVKPADSHVPSSGPAQVTIDLDDGLRSRKSWGYKRRTILKDSVVVRVGDSRWPFSYDETTDRLTVSLPTVRQPGQLVLNVQFENLFKHSNTQPWLGLWVQE